MSGGYRLDPGNVDLLDRLAMLAYEEQILDQAARRTEQSADREEAFQLTWGALPEYFRSAYRYGVRAALQAWELSGTMDGYLVFEDDH